MEAVPRTLAVAWFPPNQLELALSFWPELAEGWEDRSHAAYCRFVDRKLRQIPRDDGTRILVATVEVKPFVKWCAAEGLDPASATARERYAVQVATRGRVREWPGEPDKPCWCGRGDRYDTCCGADLAN
jgi:hypothetical protein